MPQCQVCGHRESTSYCTKCGIAICPTCTNTAHCPTCAGSERTPTIASKPQLSEKAKKRLVYFGIVFVIAIIATAFTPDETPSNKTSGVTASQSSPAPEKPKFDAEWLKTSAYSVSQQFVEKALKCPSTAKFPSRYGGDVKVVEKDGDYLIGAYVDSQNGFGAMIRSEYYCILKFGGKNDSDFTLDSLYIDGEQVYPPK